MPAEVKEQIRLEVAHVLFIDIVGYSKLSINEQRAVVDELTAIVRGSRVGNVVKGFARNSDDVLRNCKVVTLLTVNGDFCFVQPNTICRISHHFGPTGISALTVPRSCRQHLEAQGECHRLLPLLHQRRAP